MEEKKISNRDKILWFFVGVALTLAFHYFFPAKQEPVVITEPKPVEQTAPQPERSQERPVLEPKVFAELFPDAFPPELRAIINGEAARLPRKAYKDYEGIVYQVMTDNFQFYRGFFFQPTTDPVPTWYPVEELPWQVSAEDAQADLDKMAEREHWKPMDTGLIMDMRNIHSKEETP